MSEAVIVPCPVAAAALRRPAQPAVVTDRIMITYAALHHAICSVVAELQKLGIAEGDRVALRLGDAVDLPIALWAILRMRATAVLLGGRDPDETAAAAFHATGSKHLISPSPVSAHLPYTAPEALRSRRGVKHVQESANLDLARPATIVFTSGSEGQAKAVVHTLGNHWYSAAGSQKMIPVETSTRWAAVIPSHHVGGLSILFRCFLNGGTVIIPNREARNPSGLATFGVTHVSIVPTQLIDWLGKADAPSLSGLTAILVGGAATPTHIRDEAVRLGLPVHVSYGSTEMASQIATTRLGEAGTTPGYVGRVLPHRKVLIKDGQILVAGKTRFLGYWKDGAVVKPFDADGWFETGDLGSLDGDQLTVLGRRDNLFVSGGENIYPEEIENAILGSGLARRAIVVSVEHPRYGARPIAFVRPMVSIETLRSALAGTLPAFKIPDRVLPLPDDLDGSKADRRDLHRRARAL